MHDKRQHEMTEKGKGYTVLEDSYVCMHTFPFFSYQRVEIFGVIL